MTFLSPKSDDENDPQALLEEIEQLNKTIESIKHQYDELMGVALQYREEARKWYNKYIYGKQT